MTQENTPSTVSVSATESQKLLAQNVALTEEVLRLSRRTSRNITLMAIADYLRLGLLVTPFVLAALYLPPYVKQLLTWYERFGGK